MKAKIGCIADDLTGATDLANSFAKEGLLVKLFTAVPELPMTEPCDVIVVALKSRSVHPEIAVDLSLRAALWLRTCGATYFYFKVCSTFDSTPDGNIGPVADALSARIDAKVVSIVISFPENDRTVFKGHLFVGNVLLSDSSMRHHPINPMTDSSLVRLMQAQTQAGVGQVDLRTVRAGAVAVEVAVKRNQLKGTKYVVIDAVEERDLEAIGHAVSSHRMVVASSGLAGYLARGLGLAGHTLPHRLPVMQGKTAVVSGSCSHTTQRQIEHFAAQGLVALSINESLIRETSSVAEAILEKAAAAPPSQPLLVYSDSSDAAQAALNERFGSTKSAEMVERALASVAAGLVANGVTRLLVAGGETSGACIEALGIKQLAVGMQIDPGVPWCYGKSESQGANIQIALKSGNFGADDLFTRAFEVAA